MPKKIRIISLGEIVVPNLMKGIDALAKLILTKKSATSSATPADTLDSIKKLVLAAVQNQKNNIDQFKLGKLAENAFDSAFIAALKSITGIEITVDEFNNAWNAMNPEFSAFKTALEQAVKFNQQVNQELIFISYTNPKDMRHLIKELQSQSQGFTVDEQGNLIAINGIKIYLTYLAKKTKAELIPEIIKQVKSVITSPPQTGVMQNKGMSMLVAHSTFVPDKKAEPIHTLEDLDIKYIHGVNKIQFETMLKDYNATAQSVTKVADVLSVDTLLWNKDEIKSLEEMLKNTTVPCLVPSARL